MPELCRGLEHQIHAEGLAQDRALALRLRDQLAETDAARLNLLEPAVGVTPKDLQTGGPGLKRALASNFHNFVEIWASLRAQSQNSRPIYDLSSLAPLQAACPRRALLSVTEIGKGRSRAVVISLITGRVLSAHDW